MKRSPNSCFINDFNTVVLRSWQANIDIQPIFFNHHKCVTYLCSYMSKGETQCSEAIRAASLEVKKCNLSVNESLKKIGAAFLSSREFSSQEYVYRCLPELWLSKTFPASVFLDTNLPEERIRTRKADRQIADMDDNSTDISNSNIIERYADRPNRTYMAGAFLQVDNLCLAEFAAYYCKPYRELGTDHNNNQPVVLADGDLESQQSMCCNKQLPTKITLMTRRETMRHRKVRAIIRYHIPKKTVEPEKYFHHVLILYLPWRVESELIGHEGTFASNIQRTCSDRSSR